MLWLTRTEDPFDHAALQPGRRMKWYGGTQKHLDTVVFVHGILGHYVRTWGRFPRLLAEDPDLPDLDILLWGYRTGFFARHNRLQIEAGHLVTTLEAMVRDSEDIVLVGHSMGGLIILKGLVDRMAIGHAQSRPCRAVNWISLFAAPLNGVWLAGVLRKMFLLPLWLLQTLHKHMHDLSTGDFVRDLMVQVRHCMYEPAKEDERNRRIPIRIIAATRDGAVDRKNRESALSEYRNPSPKQLDETHTSIKLPLHRGDARYRVLADDLQSALIRPFKRLCSLAASENEPELNRVVALEEVRRRYRKLLRSRMARLRIPRRMKSTVQDELLILFATFGWSHNLPAFGAADMALKVLRRRYKGWQ
jgi:pimeloyl-ACP methyl ester carboxylesterase